MNDITQGAQDALLAAADEAYRMLAAADTALRSANRWFVLDLLGGMFFVARGKYDRVDTARSRLRRARRALRKVNAAGRELDLTGAGLEGLDVPASLRLRVIDQWVDDPISDGIFFLKVRGMRKAISRARGDLDHIVAQLEGL